MRWRSKANSERTLINNSNKRSGAANSRVGYMKISTPDSIYNRRHFLRGARAAAGLFAPLAAWAEDFVNLPLPGGPERRDLTTDFPQKGRMILQRSRPPLLETPFEVFDQSVFTPNDQFFVRWHWALIPTEIDVGSFRLAVRGHVEKSLSLSLDEILALPRVELIAVNQCSGNSRGYFQPRVAGGEWSNG